MLSSDDTDFAQRNRVILGLPRAIALITSLHCALLSDVADAETAKKALLGPLRATTELPDDPALPALVAIRAGCLADALTASPAERRGPETHDGFICRKR